MIALQIARWVHEAGLDDGRDVGAVTMAELAAALQPKWARRALSDAAALCKRTSERRISVAAMVRAKERGRCVAVAWAEREEEWS